MFPFIFRWSISVIFARGGEGISCKGFCPRPAEFAWRHRSTLRSLLVDVTTLNFPPMKSCRTFAVVGSDNATTEKTKKCRTSSPFARSAECQVLASVPAPTCGRYRVCGASFHQKFHSLHQHDEATWKSHGLLGLPSTTHRQSDYFPSRVGCGLAPGRASLVQLSRAGWKATRLVFRFLCIF